MSQKFITEEIVFDAIRNLISQGEQPSLIRIHEVIGRGSYSTIKKHFETWQESDEAIEANISSLPKEVELPETLNNNAISSAKKLWKEANDLAQESLEQERKSLDILKDDARIEIEQAIQYADKCNDELEEIKKQRSKQQDDLMTATKKIHSLSDQLLEFETQSKLDEQTIKSNNEIIKELKADNTRLQDERVDSALNDREELYQANKRLDTLESRILSKNDEIDNLKKEFETLKNFTGQ